MRIHAKNSPNKVLNVKVARYARWDLCELRLLRPLNLAFQSAMLFHSELRAFPAHVTAEVAAVIPALSDYQQHPPSDAFTVLVQGERLDVPYRVYYRESQVLKGAELPGTQGHVALCLGTRHHDGFLREKCVRQVIAVEQPWVVPFVTQLVGEYVLQIRQVVEHELPNLNALMYGEFLDANAALHGTISRRAVSYWNAYYGRRYPKRKHCPGFLVLTAVTRFAEHSNSNVSALATAVLG